MWNIYFCLFPFRIQLTSSQNIFSLYLKLSDIHFFYLHSSLLTPSFFSKHFLVSTSFMCSLPLTDRCISQIALPCFFLNLLPFLLPFFSRVISHAFRITIFLVHDYLLKCIHSLSTVIIFLLLRRYLLFCSVLEYHFIHLFLIFLPGSNTFVFPQKPISYSTYVFNIIIATIKG